ncbi:MAG: NFACT family protein [Candidatus Eremiobacteraeota bacterium]|nr:NFACT family protein [Candidatus Eremiobacteraeota bacterium]
MSLCSVNFSLVVRETAPLIESTRLQKFSQLTEHDFVLSFRLPGETRKLFVSLHPEVARLHLVESPLPGAQVPSAFVMLGRKHLEGIFLSRLVSTPLERVVRLEFENGFALVVEMTGRSNNLILLQDEVVVGALHRSPRATPRQPYQAPAQPDKPLASQLESLPPLTPPLARGLTACCFGLSKLYARRLSAGVDDLDQLQSRWTSFWQVFEHGPWRPGLDHRDGEPTFLAGPDDQTFASLSEAVEARFQEACREPGLEDERSVLERRVKKLLAKARLKLERRERDLEATDSAEQDRLRGDLLLAFKHQLPARAEVANLTDWEGQPLAIPLDPTLSPADNAQKYYRRYKKKQRAVNFLVEQIEKAEEEASYLEELLLSVGQAESRLELDEIRTALPERRKTKRPAAPSAGPRAFRHGGFEILVGRNPVQNDRLVQRVASRDDVWLHARDIPGSHVIIKTAGRRPDQPTILAAAILAARYSKAGSDSKVPVNVTQAQYVKKPPGAVPGRVLYKNEKTVLVDPTTEIEGLETRNL